MDEKPAVFDTLYLRIACDHLHMIHLESGRAMELHADPPFSSVRLLVANYPVAEHLIRRLMKELLPRRLLNLAPRMVVHPLERLEGGLSMVEERMLLELCRGNGARKAVVHVGEPLEAAGVRACLKKPCA